MKRIYPIITSLILSLSFPNFLYSSIPEKIKPPKIERVLMKGDLMPKPKGKPCGEKFEQPGVKIKSYCIGGKIIFEEVYESPCELPTISSDIQGKRLYFDGDVKGGVCSNGIIDDILLYKNK